MSVNIGLIHTDKPVPRVYSNTVFKVPIHFWSRLYILEVDVTNESFHFEKKARKIRKKMLFESIRLYLLLQIKKCQTLWLTMNK